MYWVLGYFFARRFVSKGDQKMEIHSASELWHSQTCLLFWDIINLDNKLDKWEYN